MTVEVLDEARGGPDAATEAGADVLATDDEALPALPKGG